MVARFITTVTFLLLQFPLFQAGNGQAVVHVVLFYSPACGHCQRVIRETMLPLIEQYGEQLQVIGVDTTQPQGLALYDTARAMFNLEFRGVPFLVIGNEYLSGSVEIPQKLPGVVEKYMAQGGVDWPDIPGLQDVINAAQTAEAPTSTSIPPASLSTQTPASIIPETDTPLENSLSLLPHDTDLTVWQRVMLDPLGNGIAITVLLLMIAVLVRAILVYREIPVQSQSISSPLIPILCLIGLGIAGYLAFVEATQITAVCGPVGDCNTVQQSQYARLFGFLPIGILGFVGYLFILISYGVAKIRVGQIAIYAKLTILILSTVGVVFSIYLTFLEPFVIGATCAWCVVSAMIMTALFLLTLKDGLNSYRCLKPPLFPKLLH